MASLQANPFILFGKEKLETRVSVNENGFLAFALSCPVYSDYLSAP